LNVREDGQMAEKPSSSGPSATVVIMVALGVLVVVMGVIVALTIALTSPQSTTRPGRDDAEDDEPQVSEIVLDATWANGSSVADDELDVVSDIITARLDELHIAPTGIELDDDQIHITFDDEVDEDALSEAADALGMSYSADFRPVLETGLCTTNLDLSDLGPAEEVIVCDEDDFVALKLGPSEVASDTIIGATAVKQTSTEYWGVTIVFNSVGAQALAEMTQRLVVAPEMQNRLGIVLDGELLASPNVTEAIFNGEVGLSGSFDEAEANSIAAQLRFASKGLALSVDSTTFAE
jgi:preprotein translocase subunit SecD